MIKKIIFVCCNHQVLDGAIIPVHRHQSIPLHLHANFVLVSNRNVTNKETLATNFIINNYFTNTLHIHPYRILICGTCHAP
ncbi:hypothetical protein QVD17_15429 [Tagetes erecta]|uniref:Uncharacterized protein n=1 Tax=Tagetes erecta TaxID=13708 RepID=A0AAD8NSM7_TARER|nr:hypothetical protein QVD17_15429 [Tagetes erecta]